MAKRKGRILSNEMTIIALYDGDYLRTEDSTQARYVYGKGDDGMIYEHDRATSYWVRHTVQ